MVSAYDRDDAAATFAALAATLNDYASRTQEVEADNGNASAEAIERCVAAMPDTEPLVSAFAEAVKCADVAHDEELAAELGKRKRELTDCWSSCDLGAYERLLRGVAAYIRAVGNDIGKNGTRDNARTDATKIAQMLEGIEGIDQKVSRLCHDRRDAKERRQKQGRESYEKGAKSEEAKRAARDVVTALKRVHDRVTRGEKNVAQVCRSVCRNFTPMGRKDALGVAECLSLKKADGSPFDPQTLAKYYRTKYGTRAERMANAAANKARTQTARDAKAAKHAQAAKRARCT